MAEMEDERAEELGSLEAIYPELVSDHSSFTATLELAVTPTRPLLVRFVPDTTCNGRTLTIGANGSYATAVTSAYIEKDIELSHLPPLCLQATLPGGYPADKPPKVHLRVEQDWLPTEQLKQLEVEAEKLWDEYGQCQILFAYIDSLQQSAERGFDLDQSASGCLVLPSSYENSLVKFDADMKLATFNAGTYDCGICLEPKKGTSCYRMARCGHVFCRNCLKDSFDNYITEGNVAAIRCLDPTCGKEPGATPGRKRKERSLHPRELLAMGIDEAMVRRYVELKRKKKMEADKSTVYCPRTWCQGPAKSAKYPPIPTDLSSYAPDSSDDEEAGHNATDDLPRKPGDRIAICEKCSLAFCRICYMGWHGDFARCFPRDPNELSAEEKASYDYIRMNTSPCPTCSSPTQKTMGCNHMKCFQCNTHFCYLCGSWLDGGNPYQHFNKAGTECYQRLWEFEEGDEGQAPEDGRGFRGARYYEQLALEAARDAQAEEDAAAEAEAQRMQNEENARDVVDDFHDEQAAMAAMAAEAQAAFARLQLNQPQLQQPAPAAPQPRPGRRQRNPVPTRPRAGGAAQAVHDHERNAQRRPRGADGFLARPGRDRQVDEIRRVVELAARNEEDDGWRIR
ncbi:RWD-domain-containing protein [Teratosphaeria nubilosa]|uniref:RBR-type E3 ubiquitin transferase n=1 Tax=Teratosphaeria nubilosa TaxID=161662 RepID=A0A6G1LD43_9PEZI|nr:RWD-domain-containing protein [Teratosphaeria nubilosa]